MKVEGGVILLVIEYGFEFSMTKDLNMYCCGKRVKTLNHTYGPLVRERYLLTFVNEGEAVLNINNEKIRLMSHDLLVVYPGEKLAYKTKKDVPWSISWVGVYGEQVEAFLRTIGASRENPVLHVANHDIISKILDDMYAESAKSTITSKIKCIGMLYEFFSVLTENTSFQNNKRSYVRDAMHYMDFCYDRKITLTEVAKSVNLEKSYFAKIFKRETGVTVTEWIRDLRVRKACRLLETTGLTVQQIALSVGVENQLYFSKIFKKIMGVAPTDYRKNLTRP